MLTPIPISRISPTSVKEFYRNYVYPSRPVVINGLADQWPALNLWDLNYFVRNFGDVQASTIPIKEGQCYADTVEGVKLSKVPIRRSIEPIAQGRLDNNMAITTPIDIFPDSFKNDFITPGYCAGRKYLNSRIWISPNGTVTPLHQDLPENLYVLVKGKKRITLFPPLSPVYVNSRLSKIPNVARVDVELPDYVQFPEFRKAQAYTVDLEAGETILIPSFWWHHLRNLEPSIALNFWWSQGWKVAISWAAVQYKKLRQVGNSDSP